MIYYSYISVIVSYVNSYRIGIDLRIFLNKVCYYSLEVPCPCNNIYFSISQYSDYINHLRVKFIFLFNFS